MENFFHCSPKTLPPIINKLIEATEVPMVRMNYNEGRNLSLTNSKVGGVGYLPANADHPVAEDGGMLVMLFQLNFAEVLDSVTDQRLRDVLPPKGILQVYFDARSYGFGMSNSYSDRPFPSDSYQVRFWRDTSLPVNVEALDDYLLIVEAVSSEYMTSAQTYNVPMDMRKIIGMDFTQESQAIHPSCIEYTRIDKGLQLPPLDEFIKLTNASDNAIEAWNFYQNELQMEYPESVLTTYGYDEISNRGGSQVLGYPDFAQGDTRLYNPEIADHILLFQLDSDMDKHIMWCDCGTAHFFIKPDDLARGDFSRMAYYWDCT